MNSEAQVRARLREWIEKTNGKLGPGELRDETPILEQRIITSLQVMDLMLFMEELTGQFFDVESLKPGSFRDINTICHTLYRERSHGS